MNKIVYEDCEYVFDNLSGKLDQIDGSTILITGAGGFLGFNFTHNVTFFKEKGVNVQVIALDNFLIRKPKWICDIKNVNFIKFLQFDIVKDDVRALLNDKKVDYIVHMASIASPSFYRRYPLETIDANVLGLRNLLEIFKDKNIKGFLFFSSSEVYGDPLPEFVPTPENYRGNVSCVGPRACYDEAKRFGETLCYYFNKIYGMPIRTVRPFNNYGPGMDIDDRRVVADFARNIFANQDIIMLSDGSPTRTFCYVADALIGYYKILINGCPGEAYNIGVEGPEISIMELAKQMLDIGKRHFGYTGKIVHKIGKDKEYLTDTPNRRCPDITKAREQLGYSPSISLNKGLLRTMYWYSDNLHVEEG